MQKDKIKFVYDTIAEYGGEREYVINWEWVKFEDQNKALECFRKISPYVEHRGFNYARPDDPNPNFRQACFRIR